MAVSANGIIASKTGSEDFLPLANWLQFVKEANKAGCFLYGRKTYEEVIKCGGDWLDDLREVKKIVISRSNINVKEGFELARSVEQAMQILKKENFREVILACGATINSVFAKKGLIDEVIFYVNPVILGNGIPIFRPDDFYLKLEFKHCIKIRDGILELRYFIRRG